MSLPLDVTNKINKVLGLLKPDVIFSDYLKFYHNRIVFKDGTFDVKGRIHIFGLGKAASFEVQALRNLMIDSPLKGKVGSAVSYTKKGHLCDDDNILQLAGSHPLITEENIDLTKVFVDYIGQVPDNDTLIFLLSGGGSALLEWPIDGMNFDQLQDEHARLLSSGLGINEMNAKRKELSQVKNGGLMKFINTRNILQLITCDIPNENIFDVSSGPLLDNRIDLTMQPQSYITQSASKLVDHLSSEVNIQSKGIFDGSVDELIKQCALDLPPIGECYISGGEGTVTIPENAKGIGGRSTHFVLALAQRIYEDDKNQDVHILSMGTDGNDGPTDAAGAYINYSIYKEYRSKEYLQNFDSYHYFEKTGTLIKTGATQNNLMDLRFIWRE